jgi:bacillithiol biosynthesis cysteine-adding enzyme BshC
MTTPVRSRVITEPLGGSSLSLAVQARRLPHDIQLWWPSSVEEWKDHATRVRRTTESSWLERLRPAIDAHGAAAERLDRVAAGRGVVLTTGQQTGLFGGPLYTLAKALTAVSFADALEEQIGLPVAPLFWAATDDADFLEASVTYTADAEGLHELKLRNPPPAGTTMALTPLGDISALLDQLRKSCGSAAHASFFELAREAFTEERTFGSAYVRLMRELLVPLGIAVLDSSHPTYREAARPTLLEALSRAPDVASAVSSRASAIRKLGFEPQVDDERGMSLVAIIEDDGKRRIPVNEARAFVDQKKRAVLAPNVLLRPVVEREILPTIAYIGGPAELAYFTESNAVAEALGKSRLVGVPRWSCTVIEPFAEKALRRLGIEYHEVRDLRGLERRLATAALPPSVASAWRDLQAQLHASVHALSSAVKKDSLMPPEVIEGLERSLGHKLSRAERRLLAAVKRRDARVRNDLQIVSAALFPLGNRQERMLNYIPMLTRGGQDLLVDMREAAHTHALTLLGATRTEAVAAR